LLQFIHLKNHTPYSICNGALRIADLINIAKKQKMPALGICDEFNTFGALEFSLACQKAEIQPIIACDILLDIDENQNKFSQKKQFHKISLIAKNEAGYQNLNHLISFSYINRQGNLDPHIKYQKLKNHKEGLILLSGGKYGILDKLIADNQLSKVNDIAQNFLEDFGDNLYIELNRFKKNDNRDSELIKLAYKLNIPLVATNDNFFLSQKDHESHGILMCISTGSYISDESRRQISPEHYFKTPVQMIELFEDIPEAIENTIKIVQRCSFMPLSRPPSLPTFAGNEVAEKELLELKTREGLEERLESKFRIDEITNKKLQEELTKEYHARLGYELGVIHKMRFDGYFLIVSDFIVWSKENGIAVGPGRGSGAGSIVAWSLKITNLDPIRFGLLFERFLNPERVSMPDFDIDFCQSRRDEVISYVQKKYGKDKVAQIITFGKLQAKAALKDVGRVMQMSYSQVDRICKMIPFNALEAVTLQKAIDMDKDLREEIKQDEQVKKLTNISLQLEGLFRHTSTHAAGIIIADKPIEKICALYKDKEGERLPAVGYSMKYAEAAGMVKFDFLGLKTLTVISEAVKLINKSRGLNLNIDDIRLDDVDTFAMLQEGNSIGVFQIESAGMRSMLRQMKIDCFEDIIALISLYRPGPMDNIPTYIKRKLGEEKIIYPHPILEPSLKETYGVIVYQEQVMEIARVMAGYSLGAADILRRAMGKKIKEEMDKQRKIFVDGSIKNKIDPEKAEEIFDLVDKFAGYGFNKSHAAAYALISYQTAYLKANFPVEFITTSMNLEIDNTDKINVFIQLAKDHGIKILPPDVNQSESYFSVSKLDNLA
jgi:DNA polymerase-3 subunit alpha